MSIDPTKQENTRLLQHVHPESWISPSTQEHYNLVIIGAGTAGLVTAAIAAAVGAKVALIEKNLMGGDCLNVGCVPSKGILRAAQAWASVSKLADFGVTIPNNVEYDFSRAMQRMRQIRADISAHDSAKRFSELGVDVFFGTARFDGPGRVKFADTVLRYKKAAICTGARASAPPIPGLSEIDYLTNESVFELDTLPKRLAIIGAGPIGCELAQAFARFGSQVTLLEMEPRVLPREDPDAASLIAQSLVSDGVQLLCNAHIESAGTDVNSKTLTVVHQGASTTLPFDQILIGAGRRPNIENLGLDSVGVKTDRSGVVVDRRLRTSSRDIYAAGDVCFPFKFTHTADAMAQILIQNALFPHPFGLGAAKTSDLIIPWCTYTSPEVAHVGLYEHEAIERGISIETHRVDMADVDRAIVGGATVGFAKLHLRQGSDEILGATIVAENAGELVSHITLLMNAGAGAKIIAKTIFPYPTQAEIHKKTVNAWRKAHFSARTRGLLQRWFAWIRG